MNSLQNPIKVSVIVPVYNVEHYLRKSILSIMNQTLKEIEIILINDGSTDNSLSIMEDLGKKDTRIKIISQPNHGQSIARNVGLIQAIGEYIYFFDSDDILEEKTLEECYQKCEENNLDFLFFDADIFTDDNISLEFKSYNRTNQLKDKVYIGTELLREQLTRNYFSASVCLTFIKKIYLDNLNLYFYPRIIHEDELFAFILYIKATRIGLINNIYFHRRLRPNSTMTTPFGEKNVKGYITVCRELDKLQREYATSPMEKRLFRKKIQELLYSIIDKMKLNSTEDFEEIKNIITFEFKNIMPWKHRFMLKWPHAFDVLSKLKQKIRH